MVNTRTRPIARRIRASKAYCDHQDALRLKLQNELHQSEQYKQYCSDEQVWTNYEYMEVFDVLAQFVCNRYPLNSEARKLGPSNTLNDMDVPTQHGKKVTRMRIDPVAEHKAVLRPYPFDLVPCRLLYGSAGGQPRI